MFIFEVTVVLYFIKILVVPVILPVTYDVIDVNECFHDFMNRAPPPRPGKFSSTALVQSLAKSLLHYSSTIRGLFADYSYYSSTIRELFVDYSLHYSSFINCPFLGWFDKMFLKFYQLSLQDQHFKTSISIIKST
jgi:hypothetical protein